jgi:Mrp family chromosome partitioning ATPase
MKAFVKELRTTYDIVVIDTPPTLAVSDAQIAGALTDGALLVLEAGRVKRDIVKKAKSVLEHAHIRILGVVLNNMSGKEAESYYYTYGKDAAQG